jgi:predicted RNA-binding protein YlxR (DUF448 family)
VAKQAKPAGPKVKHVPMRTCVGTQAKHPKRDMVRIVRTVDGHIVVDPTGKLSGSRGAYLSKSRAAAEMAVKQKRLQAEFEQPVAAEAVAAILAYFSQFETGGSG